MAAFTLTALRAELDNDPKALGYAALKLLSNAAEALANKLNEPGTVPADTLFKSYVPIEDVLAAIDWVEYRNLVQESTTAPSKAAVDQFVRGTRIKSGSSNMRATMVALFPAGTTRTALTALASRAAARAEVLWGEGFAVTPTDVGNALEL
jgi:hypothetical protein